MCTLFWYLYRKTQQAFSCFSCPLQVVCRATVAFWHCFSLLTWALQKFLSFQQRGLSQLPCQAAKQSVPLVVHFLFLLGSGYGCCVYPFRTCLLCCGFRLLSRPLSLWSLRTTLGSSVSIPLSLLDKQLILVQPHSALLHVSCVYLAPCFIRTWPYHFVVPGIPPKEACQEGVLTRSSF